MFNLPEIEKFVKDLKSVWLSVYVTLTLFLIAGVFLSVLPNASEKLSFVRNQNTSMEVTWNTTMESGSNISLDPRSNQTFDFGPMVTVDPGPNVTVGPSQSNDTVDTKGTMDTKDSSNFGLTPPAELGFDTIKGLAPNYTTRSTLNTHMDPKQRSSRGAICLVGAARDFELTGPTLKKYLLTAYPNTDVFINMPVDHKTHTLSLLADVPTLVRINVFSPRPLQEDKPSRLVLTRADSPKGLQGLLQYFNLVEGCLHLIDTFAKENLITYAWIIRTRVDTFWTGPPPLLSSLAKNKYTVPRGSNYGGLNDRFGLGRISESRAALRRLSMLTTLHTKGFRNLNSESAFAAQLRVSGIAASEINVNFCVLTRRVGTPSSDAMGRPILAISTKGYMNGAKCAPCTPQKDITKTRQVINRFHRLWGWPGPNPNLLMCSLHHVWEKNWEARFDDVVGSEMASLRKEISSRRYEACVGNFSALERLAGGVYTGPPASVVCKIRGWGAYDSLEESSQIPLYLHPLNKNSVVYAVRLTGIFSFERLLHRHIHCAVRLYKVNAGGDAMKQQTSALLTGIVFQNWSSSVNNNRKLEHLLLPSLVGTNSKVSNSAFKSVQLSSLAPSFGGKNVKGAIDMLILGVHKANLDALVETLAVARESIPVCQLILSLHPVYEGKGVTSLLGKAKRQFENLGFTMIYCKGSYGREQCLLLGGAACKP